MCSYGRRASTGPDTERKDPGSARDSRATRPARHIPWCSKKEAWWWKASLPCHLASSRDPLAVTWRKKLGLPAASRDTTSGSAKRHMGKVGAGRGPDGGRTPGHTSALSATWDCSTLCGLAGLAPPPLLCLPSPHPLLPAGCLSVHTFPREGGGLRKPPTAQPQEGD